VRQVAEKALGQDHAVDDAQGLGSVVDHVGVGLLQAQPDAGGLLGRHLDQGGPEDGCGVVGHDDGELALHRRWVDLGGGVEDRAHDGERLRGPLGQAQGQGSRLVAVAVAHEQVVAEVAAQTGQCRADGRLAQAELPGGARDVALAQQHVEGHEQVEVEVDQGAVGGHGPSIDAVDGRHQQVVLP